MGPRFNAVEIVPYRPDINCEGVYSLWERNFGGHWPITLGIFREVTEAVHSGIETHQLIARDPTGRLLGYLGSQIRPRRGTEASIVLLMVDPDCQRQGLGTRLLRTAVERFKREKITTVHVGANAELPFWQGIPTCLSVAKLFFEKHGWQIYEKSYDLIMDLRGFEPPDWVSERPRQHGVCIRTARAEDVSTLLQYLEAAFPDWRRWFVREVEARGTRNIIIACKGSQIVGSMDMRGVSSPDWTGRQWRTFLGEDMGAIGAVGVKESERNKGIGLAMVAEASRILRDRGMRNSFVHWTWLVDWYGKLGYKVWQEYWMAMKSIRGS
jgi:ribosomal protein S18 acetylase RimI-like enzyme